ncbi:MAG: histidine kinase, partial [Promethearchaeota archaeon]
SMKQLIFSREYKKEGTPSSIGLGLLLVKKILDSYKGKIRVKDRVKGDFSKGSNFILTIPEAI